MFQSAMADPGIKVNVSEKNIVSTIKPDVQAKSMTGNNSRPSKRRPRRD